MKEIGTRLLAAAGRPRGASTRGVVAALLVSTALIGCAAQVEPDYSTAPNVPVAKNFRAYGASSPAMVDDGWVRSFNSAVLNSLVAEAIAHNQDLRTAAARVEEARAIARQAGAPLLPRATATFDATRSDVLGADGTPTSGTFSPSLEASWEADVWGRLGNRRAAAQLDAVSQVAVFESVRQIIAAEVAQAWIRAVGDVFVLGLARSELSSRNRVASSVEERISAQTLLAVDGNIVRSNVAIARARVAEAEGNLAGSIRALEVLVGRYPATELSNLGGLPGMPGPLPVGLPSQLLERRPDLVALERDVAAAFHRTREAKAARLPTVTLSADLVGSGSTIGDSLNADNIVWSLVGGIIAPLIDGGLRAEEVNVRTARQEAALAAYGAGALRAFREVEDALSDEHALGHREAQLSRAENELRQAISQEQERFEAGEIDLNRVEDSRLRFYDIQETLAEVRIARLQNRVRLHLALGGSFEERPAAAEALAASTGN